MHMLWFWWSVVLITLKTMEEEFPGMNGRRKTSERGGVRKTVMIKLRRRQRERED